MFKNTFDILEEYISIQDIKTVNQISLLYTTNPLV